MSGDRPAELPNGPETAARLGALARDVIDLSGAWLWETDSNGRFTFVSAAFASTTAKSADAFMGVPREDWLEDAGAQPALIDTFTAKFRARTPFQNHIYGYPDAQGAVRFVRVNGAPLFAADGDFAGYRGVGLDVTTLVALGGAAPSPQPTAATTGPALTDPAADPAVLQAMIRRTIDTIGDGLWIFDADGRLLYANQTARTLLPRAEAMARAGSRAADLFRDLAIAHAPPDQANRWVAIFERRFAAGSGRVDVALPDGCRLSARLSPLPSGFRAVMLSDISAAHAARQSATDTQSKLRDALDSMEQGLLVYEPMVPDADPDTLCSSEWRLSIANRRAEDLLETPRGLLSPGRTQREIVSFYERRGDYDRLGPEFRAALALPPGDETALAFERTTPSGRVLRTARRTRKSGLLVVTHTDVTDERLRRVHLERQTQELGARHAVSEHLALHDPLTGLPNRRYLDDVMERTAARCHRRGERCAALHIDLDHFKRINDTQVHAEGDAVLKEAALTLATTVRRDEFVARIGGDEFVIICGSVDDVAGVTSLAERVLDRLSQNARATRASIGIATAEGRDVDPAALLRDADQALYRAKAEGRARYALFSEALRSQLQARQEQQATLRQALEDGSVGPVYEPRVAPGDATPRSVHIRAAWRGDPVTSLKTLHADLRDARLAAAADVGVIDAALRALAACGAPGGEPPMLVTLELLDPHAVDAATWEHIGAVAKRRALAIGVPETTISGGDRDGTALVARLRGSGALLQIDHFGCAVGAMAALARLRPDRVSLAPEIWSEGPPYALARAVTTYAQSQGACVCAADVHSAERVDACRAVGCDEAGGPAIAPAVDEATARTWLLNSSGGAA